MFSNGEEIKPLVNFDARAEIVEPDSPSLPVEFNTDAAIRGIDRIVEIVQHFVEEQKDEITDPQKKYIKNDEN